MVNSHCQSHGVAGTHSPCPLAVFLCVGSGWAGPAQGQGSGKLVLPPGREPGEAAWSQRPITSLPSWLLVSFPMPFFLPQRYPSTVILCPLGRSSAVTHCGCRDVTVLWARTRPIFFPQTWSAHSGFMPRERWLKRPPKQVVN